MSVPWKPDSDALPPAWRDLWDTYEILKRTSISENILANYLDTLVSFGRFLQNKVPSLESVTREQIASFLDQTKKRTSASTAGMRYRGLSAIFGWLARPGDEDDPFIPKNPMRGLRHPNLKRLPKLLQEQRKSGFFAPPGGVHPCSGG